MKGTRAKRGQLVLVEWLDSNSLGGKFWKEADDIPSLAKPVRVMSVGWVFSISAEGILVVPHFHPDEFGGELLIPMGAVVSIVSLKGPSAH